MLFYDGPVDDDVETAKLLDDPYVLVARPHHFPVGPVRLEDLKGRAMVAWPATCDQPRLEQALEASGSRPQIVFRSANNETLLSMVRSGLGFAILPELAATGADLDGRLQLHALDPGLSREIYLHWPRHRALSPLAVRAIELAKEIARDTAKASVVSHGGL
jgi:DNA-binding transcriptional LysR family regulator